MAIIKKPIRGVVMDALMQVGAPGATPADLAKTKGLKRAGIEAVAAGGALSALWRKGLVSRTEVPTTANRHTHRYHWLAKPVAPPKPAPRQTRTKRGDPKQAGATGLLDTITDYLVQERANRERILKARELLVQALALLTLPEDPLLEGLSPTEETNED